MTFLLPAQFTSTHEVQLFARGGAADIFRVAEDKRCVAVKVLRNGADTSQRQRFEQEGALGRQLRGVLGFTLPHHSFECELGLVHQMAWCGTSLAEKLEGDVYDSSQVLEMLSDVLPALHALHQLGWAHNDLKPENVLIDAAEQHSLCDLGSAWRLGQEPPGQGGMPLLLGTPQYQAPELFEGKAPSVASDIYAMGCLIVHAFCGVPPLVDTDILVLASKVFEPPPPLAAFRQGLDAFEPLVARALHQDPTARFTDALALHEAFLEVL